MCVIFGALVAKSIHYSETRIVTALGNVQAGDMD